MQRALYDRVAGTAYSLAVRILERPEAAEEVVAAVFAQVRDEADGASPDIDKLGASVLSLIRQRAIVQRNTDAATRGTGVKRERAAVEIPEPTYGRQPQLLSPAEQVRLRQALAQLAPEERAAIELVYFEGLTQDELADRLTTTIDTVRHHVQHGLLTLDGTADGRR